MGGLEPPSLSDWVMNPARYQLLTHRNKFKSIYDLLEHLVSYSVHIRLLMNENF